MTFPKSTGKLYIGYKNTPFGSNFFKGIMDDLKIFNYAITPEEVQNEYGIIANGGLTYVGFDKNATLELHRGGKDAGTGELVIFGIQQPIKRWHMLTFTANGADMKCYLDGVLVQTMTKPNSIPHSMGKLMVGIMTNVYNATTYFKGMMDELRLYNYELTPAEIQALYSFRDSLKLTAAKNTLALKESLQLITALETYKFTSPVPDANTGTNRIVTVKGMDSFIATDVTATAVYASSNTKVLTVSPAGVVTAVGKGTASVMATYKYLTVVQELTVN